MPFVVKDRVRETSTTTGSGDITLAGAPGGYQRFGAVMSIGDTCWYAIVLPGSAWETGLGTYTALNNLQRSGVFESSTGGLVTFAAGSKDVFICEPASRATNASLLFQSGLVPAVYLGTGSPSASSVLFGDQTYKLSTSFLTSGSLVQFNTYSSTQTITVPANATRALVRMWGGSGGSGSGSGGGTPGGGGAAALEKYLTGLTPGNTLALTVGAAGAAATIGNPGGNGGNTTLASGTQTITTLTAGGGVGGPVASSAQSVLGGAGGTATNGDLNISGQTGGPNSYDATTIWKGTGGMTGLGFSRGADGSGTTTGNAGIIGGCRIEWFV